MSIKSLIGLAGVVVFVTALYGGFILVIGWPDQRLSLADLASFGDSFGALGVLFSGLAFVGLIVTIHLQKQELSLQRNELHLQRVALENQANELKQLANHAVLEQVRAIIDSALRRLSDSDGEVKKPEHFFMAMMPGPEWKTLMESTNADEVVEAYKAHCLKTGPADAFVTTFSGAIRLYFKAVPPAIVDMSAGDYEFIVIHQNLLKDVPHLSPYLITVAAYAEQKIRFEAAHKLFLLASLAAAQKIFGNDSIVKDGAIQELINYLHERKIDLPAIARN